MGKAVTSRKNIVDALAKVVSLIPNTAAGRASVVHLTPSDSGESLYVSVQYPKVSYTTACPALETEGTESVALYGRRLHEILKQTSHNVSIEWDDNSVVITSEKVKWKEAVVGSPRKESPNPDGEKTYFDANEMSKAFHSVLYAVDKNLSRPSLYMVNVVDGKVRASNGFNYQEVRLGIKGATFDVSNDLADPFRKLLEKWGGDVGFHQKGHFYHFHHGGDVLTLLKPNAEFPNLDTALIRPLKAEASFVFKARRSDMLEALRRVRVSASDDFPYVEIHMSKGEALLRCIGDAGAESVASIEAIWDNKPRITTFNINYLYSLVYHAKDEVLAFRLAKDAKDRKSPLILEGEMAWAMVNQLKMRPRA